MRLEYSILLISFIFRFIAVTCDDLPETSNSVIIYTPPRHVSAHLSYNQRFIGTIATYSCSTGYQQVGGSLRACGPGGTWNGTQLLCQGKPQKQIYIANMFFCLLLFVSKKIFNIIST